ncbi:MAG: MFS transporter [Anaerolineales bacterium]|nr:MAG: MFS transporter [Anaerolineales bacterium]
MTTITRPESTASLRKVASRNYLVYLILLMGLVAIMDQYLSTVKTTALPYILEEYALEPAQFSYLEAIYLIATFLIFLLNGLNDILGRKFAILILILLMGGSALGITLFTPSIHWFMLFYTLAIFTTVSNMWAIPVSEEAPAQSRAKLVSVVYVIGLIPLQAILPPILINRLGLDWRWMYGVMSILMIPLLLMWLFMRETGRYREIKQERASGSRGKHFYGLGVIDRRDVRYIAFAALIWFCWLVNSVLYFWAGYFFMDIRGYTLNQWSLILLATLVMAMVGGVGGGWIMDRVGRKTALIVGCFGLILTQSLMGFSSGIALNIVTVISGFFISFTYTWVVVFVPEVFPTDRRGTCMGWTTTLARLSYVAGPALAGLLLGLFPSMDWFWVVTGGMMVLPIGILLVFKPFETRTLELEAIERDR